MADGVLVPSLEDNLPNVICEAHCVGTPVVAFNSGGIPEMIIHKENGFLCEAKNINELGNVGPIAPYAISSLKTLDINIKKDQRSPKTVSVLDFVLSDKAPING